MLAPLHGSRRLRLALTAVCVGCTSLFLALYCLTARFSERAYSNGSRAAQTLHRISLWYYGALDGPVRDQLAVHGRKATLHPDLVFLAIDNASIDLDHLWEEEIESSPALRLMRGGFPYPRQTYGLIAERLLGAGARAVIFDVLMGESKAGDDQFQTVIDKHPGQVIIGFNLEDRDQGARSGDRRNRLAVVMPSATLIPGREASDLAVGYVNFWADGDGRVRRSLYRTSLAEVNGEPPIEKQDEFFSLGGRALENAGYGGMLPPGRQPVLFRYASAVRPLSLHEIFVESFWKNRANYNNGEFFRGKFVLIGQAGNWTEDELITPLGERTNGPFIHISAINAALQHDFLAEPPNWLNMLLIVLAGATAWLFGARITRPWLRLLLLALGSIGLLALILFLYNTWGWFPIVFSPLATLIASGGIFSVVEQVVDRRDKARFRRTLERYVSRAVAKELLDNPTTWLNSLRGQRKQVAVLFSDVRGFTTLTEEASDEHAFVAQLNEYFQEMVGIVFANDGRLDKFIGDAVMADWGSLQTQGEQTDACQAVTTALQMRRALIRLNTAWIARGVTPFSVGIGVNHGSAIIGNLGCDEKMELSIIGDAVNIASRLEGATKTYGVDLVIGEQVATLVRESFLLRSLDLIVVKGKSRPVEVFTVLGERTPETEVPAWLAIHEEAAQLYRRGEFDGAASRWQEVLVRNPGDGIAVLFLTRCHELGQVADPSWKGVWEMKTK